MSLDYVAVCPRCDVGCPSEWHLTRHLEWHRTVEKEEPMPEVDGIRYLWVQLFGTRAVEWTCPGCQTRLSVSEEDGGWDEEPRRPTFKELQRQAEFKHTLHVASKHKHGVPTPASVTPF